MTLETLLIAGLVLLLLRQRHRLGMAPLYVLIGGLQYLQVLLAASIYVEIWPGMLVSPGSAVLFTGGLFAVLATYLEEDALGAQRLLVGVVLSNVMLALLSALVGAHASGPGTVNLLQLPPTLFALNLRVMVVGTAVLAMDLWLVMQLYERLGTLLLRWFFLRVLLAMVLTLAFDSVLFASGVFFGHPRLGALILASFIGKAASALVYAMVLALWARWRIRDALDDPEVAADPTLSWRERYHRLRETSRRDALTGLFTRSSLDRRLRELLDQPESLPLSLLFVDLDRFKQINDTAGHAVGDAVLQHVGRVVRRETREPDLPCRFGGDELVILLPQTHHAAARSVAQRLATTLAHEFRGPTSVSKGLEVTVTIGLATAPHEGDTAEALLETADRRLYLGKEAGRDRVVTEG